MSLHTQLKLATQMWHRTIEKNTLIRKLTTKQIQLHEYRSILEKLYGFIAPCESILLNTRDYQYLLQNRSKTPLLHQDLLALGSTEQSLTKLPLCQNIPRFTTLGSGLGYLYVIEGSTLGSQIITHCIQNNLALSPELGLRYFYGYGPQTKWQWQTFCDMLKKFDNCESIKNDAVHTAVHTFILLDQWLDCRDENK